MKKLLAILLIALFLRLYPLTKTDRVMGADGYYHINTVESILETNNIPKTDEFSYSGRKHIYAPGFHILSSSLALISGLNVQKIGLMMGPVLSVFSVALSYLYNPMTALFLSTLPVYLWRTTINFIPTTLWSFLVFNLIRYRKKRLALLVSLALSFTHSIALMVFPILYVSNRRKKRKFLFILLVLVSAYFWMDVQNVHQNVPEMMKSQIFEGVDLTNYVKRAGIQGILALFNFPSLFPVMWFSVFFSFVASGFIELDRAIAASSLLISQQAARSKKNLFLIMISVVWAFYMLSSLSWGYVDDGTATALLWARANIRDDAVIASNPGKESYWIAGISKRKNVMDGHFAGISDVETRFKALESLFSGAKEEVPSYLKVTHTFTTIDTRFQYGFGGFEDGALYKRGEIAINRV
jgi:hypothetical protein